jgi:hypothetical protein
VTGNPKDRSQADKHWQGNYESKVQMYVNLGMTKKQAEEKCFDDRLASNCP